jgi:hypothetical protein
VTLRVGKRWNPQNWRSVGHRQYAKEQRQRLLSIALGSAGVLFVLALIAGFVYVWYTGRLPVQAPVVVTQEEEPVATQPIKPKVTRVGVAVQLLTSPVAPGEYASLSIHTSPLARCTINLEYNTAPVKDAALATKIADEYGVVTWSWTVSKNAPIGNWPLGVRCSYKKDAGVIQRTIRIENPKKP